MFGRFPEPKAAAIAAIAAQKQSKEDKEGGALRAHVLEVHTLALKKYSLMDRQLVEQALQILARRCDMLRHVATFWVVLPGPPGPGEAAGGRVAPACRLGCQAREGRPLHQGRRLSQFLGGSPRRAESERLSLSFEEARVALLIGSSPCLPLSGEVLGLGGDFYHSKATCLSPTSE